MKKHYRIGTRGSKLALTQSQQTLDTLSRLHPGTTFELVTIKTTGDKITDVPLARIGDKGLFVKEIEQALLDREIDLAIHSMKDMPTDLPDGLIIGAVPPRKAPFDCLILRDKATLKTLPPAAIIGTGSLRRRAQLAAHRPDLRFTELRGNLPTRLAKLESEGFAATLLALAGLERLGAVQGASVVADGRTFACEVLPASVCVPAVGQGALCIERRLDDPDAEALLAPLNDPVSMDAVRAERRFLQVLQGGCQIPAGALAEVDGASLTITAVLCSLDGRDVYRETRTGPRTDAVSLGEGAARALLERGGHTLVAALRGPG